jgi:hypothetical protein
MTDDQLIQALKADEDKAQSIQDTLQKQRSDYYSRYRCEPYGNERAGWSQSVAPVIFNTVQATLPSLTEIFGEEFFTLKGQDEQRADQFQRLIYYQMFRKQDGYRKIYDFCYDVLLYHYSVFKCFRKDDYDVVPEKYDKMDPQQMMQLASDPKVQVTKYQEVQNEVGEPIGYESIKAVRKVPTYAGPWFDVLPPWEFFYSPDCKIDAFGAIKGRLVFHEVEKTLDEIQRKEKAGIYKVGSYKKVLDKVDATTPTAADEIVVVTDNNENPEVDTQAPGQNVLAQTVKLRECYYQWDIDDDGVLEPCIITKYDDIILQKEENTYGRPPFRIGSLYPEPHKVTGIALPSIIDNDQKIETNLLRLIQDSAAIACYRNPVTNDTQMFNFLQDRKPFAVILGNPDRVGEIATAPPSEYTIKAYELLKGDREEKTGVTRYNQGLDADSLNKTATGISLISNASSKRLKMMARLLGNGPLQGLVRDFIFINQKWPNEDPIMLLGTNIQVNAKDLVGDYDIDIDVGVGPAEKQAMANQLDLLIQFDTQAGLPMGLVTPLHLLKTQKKKYRLLNIPVDDLFVPEAEVQKKMEEEAQKKAQQPLPSPIKENVSFDKLYPLLTRMEQMQVLKELGIQPDPNAQVSGMPTSAELLAHDQSNKDHELQTKRLTLDEQKNVIDQQKNLVDLHKNITQGQSRSYTREKGQTQ